MQKVYKTFENIFNRATITNGNVSINLLGAALAIGATSLILAFLKALFVF